MQKVILFGAGSGLHDFLSIIPPNLSIVAISDNDEQKQGNELFGFIISPPADIPEFDFDFIVVTSRAGEAIRRQLQTLKIPNEKILLFYPSFNAKLHDTVNADIDALNEKLSLTVPRLSLCNMPLWPMSNDTINHQDDFCRSMAIQLAAKHILTKQIHGAIAELGVYRGDTSSLLNKLFPNRPLYLFDTFTGFDERDFSMEINKSFSNAVRGDFSNTSMEFVLSRMPHSENVKIYQGYFPTSAEGIDEIFAFVSIDVDLQQPTLAGLEFFYSRLSPGGYIFVHDYHNVRFKGVRDAVDTFVAATNAPVVFLPDFSGTAILSK